MPWSPSPSCWRPSTACSTAPSSCATAPPPRSKIPPAHSGAHHPQARPRQPRAARHARARSPNLPTGSGATSQPRFGSLAGAAGGAGASPPKSARTSTPTPACSTPRPRGRACRKSPTSSWTPRTATRWAKTSSAPSRATCSRPATWRKNPSSNSSSPTWPKRRSSSTTARTGWNRGTRPPPTRSSRARLGCSFKWPLKTAPAGSNPSNSSSPSSPRPARTPPQGSQ